MPSDSQCTEEVCLTCGDVAVRCRVVELRPGRMALVDSAADPRACEEISVALVTAEVGDVVLVHAKEAIALIPPPHTLEDER